MQKIDISDSRAVIQYVEHLHMTCSFRVTSESTHKMSYQNGFAMPAWIDNLLIKSCTQLEPRALVRYVKCPYTTFTF